MNERIENLVRLQKLDIRLQALLDFLEGFPRLMSELAEEKRAAEEEMENKRAELDQAKKELRRLERLLAEGEEKLRQIQARLNQVKTNKEYEACLKEEEEQKKKNSDLESEILVGYDKVEAAEKARAILEAQWEEKANAFAQREKELREKQARAQAEAEEKKREREELAATFPAELIKMYEKIRQARGRALARAEKEVCLGCHHHIPAQMFNQVLKGETVVSCPNCLRLLVHLETELDDGLLEI